MRNTCTCMEYKQALHVLSSKLSNHFVRIHDIVTFFHLFIEMHVITCNAFACLFSRNNFEFTHTSVISITQYFDMLLSIFGGSIHVTYLLFSC